MKSRLESFWAIIKKHLAEIFSLFIIITALIVNIVYGSKINDFLLSKIFFDFSIMLL